MQTGLITPPRKPIPPRPVGAILLPPKDPQAAPMYTQQASLLDLDDDAPLAGGSCSLDGPCESCQ